MSDNVTLSSGRSRDSSSYRSSFYSINDALRLLDWSDSDFSGFRIVISLFLLCIHCISLYHVTFSYLGARAVAGLDHVPCLGGSRFDTVSAACGHSGAITWIGRPRALPQVLYFVKHEAVDMLFARAFIDRCRYNKIQKHWEDYSYGRVLGRFAKRTGAPCAYEIRPWFRCLNERARLIRTGYSCGFVT